MMARLRDALRTARAIEARVSDSVIGDLIGAISLFVICYGVWIAGAVLL